MAAAAFTFCRIDRDTGFTLLIGMRLFANGVRVPQVWPVGAAPVPVAGSNIWPARKPHAPGVLPRAPLRSMKPCALGVKYRASGMVNVPDTFSWSVVWR